MKAAAAVDIGRAVRTGRMRARDSVGDALRRLRLVDGRLRAFVEVTEDAALAAARELDERIAAAQDVGILAGVPIAVKGRLGAQVTRLRAAGAVPIGVTSMPIGTGPQTWGHTPRGPTRNPWRPDPALSIPAGFTADGAPVGLQLVARPHADGPLLRLARRPE